MPFSRLYRLGAHCYLELFPLMGSGSPSMLRLGMILLAYLCWRIQALSESRSLTISLALIIRTRIIQRRTPRGENRSRTGPIFS